MLQENSNLRFSRPAFWLLSVALLLSVLVLCGTPRPENDLFWQLRTGRDIIQQHTVPHADTFSWTAHGHPWVVHEWLALALFWTAYSAASAFVGLFILKAVILSATMFIFFRYLCWATNYRLIPTLFLTGLAMMSASIGFEMRPQLFTYLFLTLVCSLILRTRDASYEGNKIWWLVPIFVTWANVHSGVIAGLFLLTAWCVGDFVDGVNNADVTVGRDLKRRAMRLLPVIGACLIGTMITPYGLAEYTDFFATLHNSNMINSVSEWASPTLHDSAGMNFCFLAGILIAGLIFTKRVVLLGDIIILMALLHSSLTSYRNIPLFAIAGTMIGAQYLVHLKIPLAADSKETADADNKSIFGTQPEIAAAMIASVGLVFICFVATLQSYKQEAAANQGGHLQFAQIAEQSINTGTEPVSGTEFMKKANFPATWKMYNGYDEGGYLVWMLPQYPVSIDSRADLYFGSIFDDYLRINSQKYRWKGTFEKYPSDFVLTSAGSGLSKLLMCSPDWALVYVSDTDMDAVSSKLPGENTVIFVRRGAKADQEIARIRGLCPPISTSAFMTKYEAYPAVH